MDARIRILVAVAALLCCGVGRAAGLSTFADGITWTNEIHVATNGNNTTGNGSFGNPYATIQRAAQDATPGSAIVVAPGTYGGGNYISGLTGTAESPIWIRGASSTNRPLMDGGNDAMHLVKSRYVVVENLEVTGSSNNGVNCDDGGEYANPNAAHHIVFRNLSIHDIGGTGNQDGLKLSGLNNYWVLDCEFARCGGGFSGSGIDHVGCHSGVIARCTFNDMSGNAIQCKGGSSDIDITRCWIIDAGARGINIGGSTGFTFFRPPLSTTTTNYEAKSIRVVGNVFRGSTAPVAYVGCIDSVVANNTFIDTDNWHVRILQETTNTPPYSFYTCGQSVFANNLVYFTKADVAWTDINVGPNTDASSFTFANNLWYAHDNPGSSAPDYPVAEQNGVVGQNPVLSNPAGEEYWITATSPATTNGTNLATVQADYVGTRYLAPPSIGAYEIRGDTDTDKLPDIWEIRHFRSITTSDGTGDQDGDRFPDRSEYEAGTDPTNAASRLSIKSADRRTGNAVELRWPSVPNRTYAVYYATNLSLSNAFAVVTNGLPTTAAENVYTDSTHSAHARVFYRVTAQRN